VPLPLACSIDYLRFDYIKKSQHTYFEDIYSIFSMPENGILDNPRLEYYADNCETCTLSFNPNINDFIKTNNSIVEIFGNLEGIPIEGFENRYIFSNSDNPAILDLNPLKPGSYEFTLTCNDPVTGVTETKILLLKLFGEFR